VDRARIITAQKSDLQQLYQNYEKSTTYQGYHVANLAHRFGFTDAAYRPTHACFTATLPDQPLETHSNSSHALPGNLIYMRTYNWKLAGKSLLWSQLYYTLA